MITYSHFKHDYINTYKYYEPISNDYSVLVNGEEIPVYTCRISKIPFNRAWPGHQREINQSEIASFVNIISDEKLDIKVIVNDENGNLIKVEARDLLPFAWQPVIC